MALMCLQIDTYPVGERLGFLVDKRSHTQELFDAWKRLSLDSRFGINSRLGPAAFYSRREVISLQAADLLAHELYLQRLKEITTVPPPDPQNYPYRAEFLMLRPAVNRVVLHWDQANKRLHDYDAKDDESRTTL